VKQEQRYFRTSDLAEYKVVGYKIIVPAGMAYEQMYHVLHSVSGKHQEVDVFSGLNMSTTRDWATSLDMAIANKIKLLENEIVSLELRRENERRG